MSFAQLILKQASRRPSTASDVGHSFLSGLQAIPGSILGVPGDVQHLQNEAELYGARTMAHILHLSPAEASRRIDQIRLQQAFGQYSRLPTSGAITRRVSQITGYHYTPQTTAGKITEVATTLVGGAAVTGGVGGLVRGATRAAATRAAGASGAAAQEALDAAAFRPASTAGAEMIDTEMYHATNQQIVGTLRPTKVAGLPEPTGISLAPRITGAVQYGGTVYPVRVQGLIGDATQFMRRARQLMATGMDEAAASAQTQREFVASGYAGVRFDQREVSIFSAASIQMGRALSAAQVAQRVAATAGTAAAAALSGVAHADEIHAQSDAAQDRTDQQQAGPANGRVWVRGHWQVRPKHGRVWIRGHWQVRAHHR